MPKRNDESSAVEIAAAVLRKIYLPCPLFSLRLDGITADNASILGSANGAVTVIPLAFAFRERLNKISPSKNSLTSIARSLDRCSPSTVSR